MAIDPQGADLKRLLADDDGGLFVMLNLLRFADGKREQYDEYVTRADEFVKRYGGELLTTATRPRFWSPSRAGSGRPSCLCAIPVGRRSARWWPIPTIRPSRICAPGAQRSSTAGDDARAHRSAQPRSRPDAALGVGLKPTLGECAVNLSRLMMVP